MCLDFTTTPGSLQQMAGSSYEGDSIVIKLADGIERPGLRLLFNDANQGLRKLH